MPPTMFIIMAIPFIVSGILFCLGIYYDDKGYNKSVFFLAMSVWAFVFLAPLSLLAMTLL